MIIGGIDPGLKGGIAVQNEDGEVFAYKMPETKADILELLRELFPMGSDAVVYCEKVGRPRPGSASGAVATFANHCGHLEMALLAIPIRHQYVSPTVWMKISAAGAPKGDGNKTKRKNFIKTRMQERFPGLKITHATSDALGILAYAIGDL